MKKTIVIILLLTLAATAAASGMVGLGERVSADDSEHLSVVVRQGDTLWEIAREHNPGYRDLRVFIDRIMRLNGLETANIRAGQELLIPTSR